LAWYPCPLAVDFRLCLFPLLQTRPRLPRLQRGAEDERPVVSSGTHLGGKVCWINLMLREREEGGAVNFQVTFVCVRCQRPCWHQDQREGNRSLARSALLSTEGEPACDPRFVTMESVWGSGVRKGSRLELAKRKCERCRKKRDSDL
jgi:hypothetical protein